MGARCFDPGTQRFLQLDQFLDALADLASIMARVEQRAGRGDAGHLDLPAQHAYGE